MVRQSHRLANQAQGATFSILARVCEIEREGQADVKCVVRVPSFLPPWGRERKLETDLGEPIYVQTYGGQGGAAQALEYQIIVIDTDGRWSAVSYQGRSIQPGYYQLTTLSIQSLSSLGCTAGSLGLQQGVVGEKYVRNPIGCRIMIIVTKIMTMSIAGND